MPSIDWGKMASFPENGDTVEVKYKRRRVEATDDQTFGLFDEEELNIWYNTVYFCSMDEKVKVRKVAEGKGRLDQIIS